MKTFNLNLPYREDIYFLVTISNQCMEQAQVIKEENVNVDDRLETLLVILNDAIVKLGKLQDAGPTGIGEGYYYYQNLIGRI